MGISIAKAKELALKWTAHEVSWFKRNLTILDRYSKEVPFEMNVLQKKLAYNLNIQKALGFPVRGYLLKARKVGFSTYTEGRMYMHAVNQRNVKGLVVAHSESTTLEIFNMTRRFDECLPPNLYLPKQASSTKQIVFSSPHNSELKVAYAGGREVGRGMSPNRLHLSEYFFFPYEKIILALMNSVASENVDTEIIMESTANGAAGSGYEDYMAAVKRVQARPDDYDGFQPLFFSWLEVPWYTKELPKGMTLDYTEEERRLKSLGSKSNPTTDEQLYWRRKIIEEKMQSDENLFRQEMPATHTEAFLCSARSAFPSNIISYHTDLCEDAKENNKSKGRWKLEWTDKTRKKVKAVKCNGYEFGWEIWEWPHNSTEYAIGADIAEGIQCDLRDHMSTPDFSCAAIKDRRANAYVATWRGRIDADEFGDELLKAALYYNKAYICPEANNAGAATLSRLKGYPNLYHREGAVDSTTSVPLHKLGFRTDSTTRNWLIDEWMAACKPDPLGMRDAQGDASDMYKGSIKVYDQSLLEEEMSFVVNARGKREHKSGCHDDMLFAHMLAHRADLVCPRKNWTQHEYNPRRAMTISDLSRPGAYDPGPAYIGQPNCTPSSNVLESRWY